MKLLDVSGLAKKYGRRLVVQDVSFDVGAGEIVGLLGPNGAGKTTSFRMTCGMIAPDRGRVLLDGQDVTRWPMHRRAREGGLGYLPQQSSVFGKLTVKQNLSATMQLLGFPTKQRQQETAQLLNEFGLEHIQDTLASQVSGGERRRLEIARCLISRPKMIMLDEPFAGIDPVTVQGIQGIIQGLAARGLGILITDHAAREILQITRRTYVISEGAVLCSGTPQEVASHPEVKRKYLGVIDSFEIAPSDTATTDRSQATRAAAAPHVAPTAIGLEPADSPPATFVFHDAAIRQSIAHLQEAAADPNTFVSAQFPQFSNQPPNPSPVPEVSVTPPTGGPRQRQFFPQPKTIRQGP